MLVISEFRPKNIMISDFWTKKLPSSGMTRLTVTCRLANSVGKGYSTSLLQ